MFGKKAHVSGWEYDEEKRQLTVDIVLREGDLNDPSSMTDVGRQVVIISVLGGVADVLTAINATKQAVAQLKTLPSKADPARLIAILNEEMNK